MIVYLGMPRCAISWLYDHMVHLETGPTTPKETHYLYTQPVDPVGYCKQRFLDFSTNNWSMDSHVVKQIDPAVSHYVMVFRDPVQLAVSYRSLLKNTQTLDEFVKSMILNRLLCFGDIVERWQQLVDPKKLLIYSYTDIAVDPIGTLNKIYSDLGVAAAPVIDTVPTNVGYQLKIEPISQENTDYLLQQVDKFCTITGIGNLIK